MKAFDPTNKEHRQIVKEAIHNADQFGAGYLTAARNQLDMYDIEVGNEQVLADYIFETFVLKA